LQICWEMDWVFSWSAAEQFARTQGAIVQRKAVAVQKQCTCSQNDALEPLYFKDGGKEIMGKAGGRLGGKAKRGYISE